MRVLLINSNREQAPQPAIPLGVCLVASSLEAKAFEPRVLDLCFSRDVRGDLARTLDGWQPDVVGLAVHNLDNGDYLQPRSYLDEAVALVGWIRARSLAPLVIGGPAVSVAPRGMLRLLQADYAIVGEGEEAFPDLLQRLSAGMATTNLPGVCARSADGPSIAFPAQVKDLRVLPFARAARWLDLPNYLRRGSPLPVQTKRGCRFECSYCTYRLIEGWEHRLRSPQAVAAEMWDAKNRLKINRFEIVDAVFNDPLEHALALCEAIIHCNLDAEVQTIGLQPGFTSPELIQLMARAGVTHVICTPDTGSERVLERLRKGFTLDQVARTAGWARDAGLRPLWCFTFGAPGETPETVRETLRFMEGVFGPNDRLLCTLGLRIYPGTELARTACDEGLVEPTADLLRPTFYFSPQISAQRVLSLLEGSRLRPQMVYLSALQSRLVACGLRLRRALHLPGPPWSYVPVYNRIARLAGGGRARLGERGRRTVPP